jgi:AcrR family transcriptional regulator
VAEQLFVSQGFSATSMREIAQATGLGKSTLYDYFSTKDDILGFAIEEKLGSLTRRAQVIADGSGPAADRLREVMRMHLSALLDSGALFMQVMVEGQKLRPETLQGIQNRRYAYQDLVRDLVEQGIDSGEFRDVNAVVAMKILLALMAPVVWTTRPVGTPDEMLEDALDILVHGLVGESAASCVQGKTRDGAED